MNQSKKEEYQNAVDRIIKREDLEAALEKWDNENDEGDDAATGR